MFPGKRAGKNPSPERGRTGWVEALERQHPDNRFDKDQRVGCLVCDSLERFRRHAHERQLHADRCGGWAGQAGNEAVAGGSRFMIETAENPVPGELRDNHVGFNLAAIPYTMLYPTALTLGDEPPAELAVSSRRACAANPARSRVREP